MFPKLNHGIIDLSIGDNAMTTTATVFEWEDFPTEIKDYFEDCAEYVTNTLDSYVNFPLDWTIDDFELELERDESWPSYVDAYFEVVTYLKGNMVAGTELAIVN